MKKMFFRLFAMLGSSNLGHRFNKLELNTTKELQSISIESNYYRHSNRIGYTIWFHYPGSCDQFSYENREEAMQDYLLGETFLKTK